MKNISLLVTLLLGALLAVPTHAQTVKIEVQKSTAKNLKVTARSGGSYTKKQGTEGISYTITISNHSSGSLSNAIVKWYILVSSTSTYAGQSMRVVNGTQNINLGRGQDVTFDTDPVNLNVTKYNTSYGYNSRYGDQVDGYVVKVIQGEKVLAVDCKPQDAVERLNNINKSR